MKIKIFFVLFNLATFNSYSQYRNAMQMGTAMSINTLQGSAKFVATGGVLGSVGPDLSNLSTNPAAIGMFSRTEFQFTPTIQSNATRSNYQYILNGNSVGSSINDESMIKFTLNNLGVVFANRSGEGDDMRSSNIAVAINRTADFNRTLNFGVNDNSAYSMTNYLADLSTVYKLPSNPIPSDYYAMDNDFNRALTAISSQAVFKDNAGNYQDPVKYMKGNVSQFGQEKITGGVTELSVAWAASIQDKYYIGVAMGVPFVSYTNEFIMSEVNKGATVASPNSAYGNYLNTTISETDKYSGTGVNLKLGGLIKLNNSLKVSGYFHSPTLYSMTNDYIVGMTTKYQNSTIPRSQAINDVAFNYYTPLKAGAGISYLFGKNGFLAAEYEFNNLKGLAIGFENKPQDKSFVNSNLSKYNSNFHTIKIGGELKADNFFVRAGYNYRTSPKASNYITEKGDMIAHTFSGGIGYRGKSTSIDLAYMHTAYRDFRDIYSSIYSDAYFGTANWNSINQFSATINFRFNTGER